MSAASPSTPAPGSPLLLTLLQARTYVALLLVFGFFAVMAPNFLSVANSVIVAKHAALTAFLAIGMTFVIITGGIDLSVGSTVGLCSMVSGWLILYGIDLGTVGTMHFNTLEITLIVMCVGVFVGFINGILITKLNVAPFIATLGTLYIARGAALLSSGGRTFPNLSGNPDYGSDSFPAIGAGTFLGLPVQIWMLIAVGLVAAYIARRTPLGRHIYAVGGNERGAALSGVKVNRVKLFVYMFSGFCAAIVGLIIASQLQAAHPATGETFELNAIAAAVLGGTSLSGGRGKIGGTIVGAFVISILSDGLVMMSVSSFWQTVIKGLVIVAAVVIDQAQSRLQARVALQQEAALGR
ncbi:ABC transporter permease [Rhodobacter capsulatus]|uniref:Erythritol transport system permease protein n=1 Tax=Rhodobacter capsulatus TaxID=1061 RepID=A0A0Q0UTX7_RHOCA|nr:ABC transporter permease [Rhodobacter capsulatus]KQB16507.1 sugar ABC transporter permease [Rhodobacter capsulatus]KQB17017.1 sugar ABC transporter permease [Rhodobacter capsulatus]PZX21883.1 erythritol transport system permease protein [Rhodobacter capsulatus]QNR62479.1 ABC transporter permease [Rhodobacter capsulatus]WER08520.1 ABC transporter permease [Rhodobacter capsulatus]